MAHSVIIPEVAAAKLGSGGQPEREAFLLCSSFTKALNRAVEILGSNPFPTCLPPVM